VGVATAEQIRFLRRLAPPQVRVKASGGIKTAQQVRELLEAGADLVGTSSGVRIMQELSNELPALPATRTSQY
jgi:deoxyribose-phosphate aldolase